MGRGAGCSVIGLLPVAIVFGVAVPTCVRAGVGVCEASSDRATSSRQAAHHADNDRPCGAVMPRGTASRGRWQLHDPLVLPRAPGGARPRRLRRDVLQSERAARPAAPARTAAVPTRLSRPNVLPWTACPTAHPACPPAEARPRRYPCAARAAAGTRGPPAGRRATRGAPRPRGGMHALGRRRFAPPGRSRSRATGPSRICRQGRVRPVHAAAAPPEAPAGRRSAPPLLPPGSAAWHLQAGRGQMPWGPMTRVRPTPRVRPPAPLGAAAGTRGYTRNDRLRTRPPGETPTCT
jgi:hypothetical protein